MGKLGVGVDKSQQGAPRGGVFQSCGEHRVFGGL